MSDTILLVDREVETLRALGAELEEEGREVAREVDPVAALETLGRLNPCAAVVDYGLLAGASGRALLDALRGGEVPFIAVLDTGSGDALEALRSGADRVLHRPLDMARLRAELTPVVAIGRRRWDRAGEWATWTGALQDLGTSPVMREVGRQVTAAAAADRSNVLITGEFGVGKSWAARLIHALGPRAGEPFMALSTVGEDGSDLEVRLVGAERWVRPGVERRVYGLMELAGRGTLLIREIAGLPRELQPALLRSLEVASFRRVGGDRDLAATARLIATSSGDLAGAMEADRFHGDLYYRLNSLVVHIPPLRDRARGDRVGLIETIYGRLPDRLPSAPPPLSPEALERLLEYHWPGNVRELQNVLERAAFLALGQPAMLIEHLPGQLRARPGLGDRRHNPVSLEEVERRQIESALRYHGGNRTRAAKELRISRATLINKIKRYALSE